MELYFEEGLSARHRAGKAMKLVPKAVRGKNAFEKLTEEELVKFSARVAIQRHLDDLLDCLCLNNLRHMCHLSTCVSTSWISGVGPERSRFIFARLSRLSS